jgi:hypothetical protein
VISEKTVELNLTAELLNWLFGQTGSTHFVIAPSQVEEADLGFDASFHGTGAPVFIQFKRAYVKGSAYTWKLNRTAAEDQHHRLQILQALGASVFYAFPLFHTGTEVAALRRSLLMHTLWVPPLSLHPSGGPTGPHDLTFDSTTGTWELASPEPIRIGRPGVSLEVLVQSLAREASEGEANRLIALANGLLFRGARIEGPQQVGTLSFAPDKSCATSLSVLGAGTV